MSETLEIHSILTQLTAREVLISLSRRQCLRAALITVIKFNLNFRPPAMLDIPLCLRCTHVFNTHGVPRVSLVVCDYDDELYNFLFSMLAATKGVRVETVISK
jgi:hypothetical protein